jgi:uncharacterized membrane protein YraQ (UPF0718 family)
MNQKSLTTVFLKSLKGLLNTIPMMIGVILLIGLMKSFISFESFSKIFTQNRFIDTVIGAFLGSILAGNSINSYIIGNEMIISGVSLFAVTAFLISWVTVGFVQIPMERQLLGTQFTITRNILSIIFAILISLSTVWLLGVFS